MCMDYENCNTLGDCGAAHIPHSVIETLDQMKKGKDTFAAREAIKFLERELKRGNRFVRAQKPSETPQPGKRKPHRQDPSVW